MKKSLAALAVLGAFAGSAFAADVTLYGLVDYGFNYQHVDADTGADAQDSFRMMSGQNSGSRFGLDCAAAPIRLQNRRHGAAGRLHPPE